MAVEVLTLQELAKEARVCYDTLQKEAKEQRIPGCIKIRGQWRITRANAEKWLNGEAGEK